MSTMTFQLDFHGLFLHVVLILFCFFPCNIIDADCSGRPHGCCEGYEFNNTSGKCEECRVGFYGKYCTVACPFPSYGRDCQDICNCPIDDCNFVMGCQEKTIGEISMNTTKANQRKYRTTALQYALIGMSLLLVIITIAYMGLHVSQWRASKTTTNG
uniref:Scavenger receptor class F member 2-like n=1 Tax=Crassostrea virginica TaxID=6565 RepID=A0A8B8AD76_CRAVI|nr:scavenger receptor class F member 2-like [Crassostrea virginica]